MLIMPKRIPEETKQRAMRLVLDHLDDYPNLTTACDTVAGELGFGGESSRRWVPQAQVDAGQRDGVTTADAEEMARLRRENRELREANAIPKDAAVFFAGELDPRRR
jgi:transposase